MSTCLAPPDNAPVLFRPEISLHGPDDCAFLLDRRGGKVYATNAPGAFLWRCLARGMSPAAAAGDLAFAAGLPIDTARHHLSVILSRWENLDLIGDAQSGLDHLPRERRRRPARSTARPRAWPIAAAAERRYGLLDTSFLVRFFDQAIADGADGVLEALPGRSVWTDCSIDVVADGGHVVIACDGYVLDRCTGPGEIVPTLKARLLHIALERDAPHGVLHAAALAKDDGTLLLPAPAGSGKSSLAAGLVCGGGWRLIADDLVPLGNAVASVRAVPTAICLKEGAWHLLRRLAPELSAQPVFVRQDGKRVRYLRPKTDRKGRFADPLPPVRWIVFPRHAPNARPRLVRLSRQAGVERLLPQFFSRGGALEPSQLDRLIALAGRAVCHDLEMGTLDQGVALIREATG